MTWLGIKQRTISTQPVSANRRRLQSRAVAAWLQLGRWVNGYKCTPSTGSSLVVASRETRLFARCHIHLRPGEAVGCLPRWWIACGILGLTSNCRRERVRARREKGECARPQRATAVTPALVGRTGKVRERRVEKETMTVLFLSPPFTCHQSRG